MLKTELIRSVLNHYLRANCLGEKGAFGDATEYRIGRLELASGSILFLDEIGNLFMAMQAKLLGVLQIRQIVRLVDNQLRTIDIRLICATNKNLARMVKVGEFRGRYCYRLPVCYFR